ncbi:uncharacterized protein LOC110010581 [Jatropha curcas]|uniref:uncharacterized protein LOC110010581 n=1 Tax=Jatropha curcas TaxID=180498 RepID=UPI0009D63FCA|nr:uncharacterized protein LOC110010581 [Jatropha curcas]
MSSQSMKENKPHQQVSPRFPSSLHPNDRHDSICGINICELISCFSFLSLITFIVFLASQTPKFQVSVESMALEQFNISSTHITANWNVSFSIANTYRYSLFSYDDIQASILFKNQSISSSSIGRFSQSPGEEKLVQANVSAYSLYINQTLAAELIAQKKAFGAITWTFNLSANFTCTNSAKSGFSSRGQIRVSCEELEVVFISNLDYATLLHGPISCDVDILQ